MTFQCGVFGSLLFFAFVNSIYAIEQSESVKLGREGKYLNEKISDSRLKDIKIRKIQEAAQSTYELQHYGCVPADNSSLVTIPKFVTDDINVRYGTKVDFSRPTQMRAFSKISPTTRPALALMNLFLWTKQTSTSLPMERASY